MYIHPLFQIKLIITVAFQLMKNSMIKYFCGKMLLLSGAGGGDVYVIVQMSASLR